MEIMIFLLSKSRAQWSFCKFFYGLAVMDKSSFGGGGRGSVQVKIF